MEEGHYWVRYGTNDAWSVAYLDEHGNWWIHGNEETQETPPFIITPALEEPDD